jgi:hypothetical protein
MLEGKHPTHREQFTTFGDILMLSAWVKYYNLQEFVFC